jgi:hypothetical protein
VLGLSPLEGKDECGRRFERSYYVAANDGREVGCARVVLDRVDARARIMGLRTIEEGVRGPLLATVVDDLIRHAQQDHLIILVWVRGDAGDVQEELERLGFFPTAYLPEMVAGEGGRCDGVQYTRLIGKSLADSVTGLSALEWGPARLVIEEVLRSGQNSPTTADSY